MPDLKGQRCDLQAAAAMRMFGLSRVQHFWEPTKDSRVLLGWSRTTCVLAFRGTASLKNARTDIAVCVGDSFTSSHNYQPLSRPILCPIRPKPCAKH